MRVQGPGQAMVRVAVTMRTPGHDRELAVGFLYTEGLIHARHEIVAIQTESPADDQAPCNVVTVHLTHPIDPTAVQRNFYTTSSCGICGKTSLDQIAVHCAPVAPGPVLDRTVLEALPTTLRNAQQLFVQTGGLHARGLFEVSGPMSLTRVAPVRPSGRMPGWVCMSGPISSWPMPWDGRFWRLVWPIKPLLATPRRILRRTVPGWSAIRWPMRSVRPACRPG